MTILAIDEIKRLAMPIFKKYSFTHVYLFGSYARGEATENSDIDLFFESVEPLSYLDIFSVENELEKALGKSVDLVPFKQLSEAKTPIGQYMFNNKIQQEKVVVS